MPNRSSLSLGTKGPRSDRAYCDKVATIGFPSTHITTATPARLGLQRVIRGKVRSDGNAATSLRKLSGLRRLQEVLQTQHGCRRPTFASQSQQRKRALAMFARKHWSGRPRRPKTQGGEAQTQTSTWSQIRKSGCGSLTPLPSSESAHQGLCQGFHHLGPRPLRCLKNPQKSRTDAARVFRKPLKSTIAKPPQPWKSNCCS